jgi:hypothetical protein
MSDKRALIKQLFTIPPGSDPEDMNRALNILAEPEKYELADRIWQCQSLLSCIADKDIRDMFCRSITSMLPNQSEREFVSAWLRDIPHVFNVIPTPTHMRPPAADDDEQDKKKKRDH